MNQGIYEEPRFLLAGDKALVVEFGSCIAPGLSQIVRRALFAINKAEIAGLIEAVPTYRSILVYYEPLKISAPNLEEDLRTLVRNAGDITMPQPLLTEVPTVYGGAYGPDMEHVARHNGITAEEVVRLHTGTPYLIYMLGSFPGFAYLGGISPKIATPRLKTPRLKVPAGSVAIGGIQTGVYPTESPGGWNLIGRTPLRLFEADKEPPALLKAGDYVVFRAITPREFDRLEQAVARESYEVKQVPLDVKSNGISGI